MDAEEKYLAKIRSMLPWDYAIKIKNDKYFNMPITVKYIKSVADGIIKDPYVMYELIMYSKKQNHAKQRI